MEINQLKPTSLCLIQMGQKGLELVKSFPAVLTSDELNKIIFQSIPFGSKEGDFVTRTVDNNVICGYVFSLPKIGVERANIATLTAVYDSMDFQPKHIKRIFTLIVKELQKNRILSIDGSGRFTISIPDNSSISGRYSCMITDVIPKNRKSAASAISLVLSSSNSVLTWVNTRDL